MNGAERQSDKLMMYFINMDIARFTSLEMWTVSAHYLESANGYRV